MSEQKQLMLSKEQVMGIFALAGIPVIRMWEIKNKYCPEECCKHRLWWLVKTPRGLIEIGWRKRVISIEWSDTDLRKIVTTDDVTKGETYVHAWSYENATEYLRGLFQ